MRSNAAHFFGRAVFLTWSPMQVVDKEGRLVLRAHLSDRPNTHAIHTGEVGSSILSLDICGPTKNTSRGFPMLLRDRAFDFSELSLMTCLQARAAGLPLVLLPAVILARFPHRLIWVRADRARPAPQELQGLRVGARAYTVTTVVWARGVLQHQYGVDPGKVTWVVNEPSHLPGFKDPSNVVFNDLKGRSLEQSLLNGDIDAAILNKLPKDPAGMKPLLQDPEADALAWHQKTSAISLNHLAVVSTDLSQRRPDVVRELFHMLKRARDRAPANHLGIDATPFGLNLNHLNFKLAIEYAFEQGVIPRRLSVDELFDETTAALV
jgi:4,5-dihydroxyphthalate decarboxylase